MFIDFGRMSARMNRLDRKLINYKILIAPVGKHQRLPEENFIMKVSFVIIDL